MENETTKMYNGLYEIKITFSMINLFLQKTFIGQPKIIQDYIRVFVSLILMKKLIESKFCHNSVQRSGRTERKSSVQFKSSLLWWTLNWTQFTFLLKELELNLVHLLSELEQKLTEKFSSFFYYKTKVFWYIFIKKCSYHCNFFMN